MNIVSKCGKEPRCQNENTIVEKLNKDLSVFVMPFEDGYWFD
jgi:hypothetical protein